MDIETIQRTIEILLALIMLGFGFFTRQIILISVGIGSLFAEFLYIKGFSLFSSVLIGGVISLLLLFTFAYITEN